jgi:hypothetical protein
MSRAPNCPAAPQNFVGDVYAFQFWCREGRSWVESLEQTGFGNIGAFALPFIQAVAYVGSSKGMYNGGR